MLAAQIAVARPSSGTASARRYIANTKKCLCLDVNACTFVSAFQKGEYISRLPLLQHCCCCCYNCYCCRCRCCY